MPISLKYTQMVQKTFDYPFRCFVSGSSQSGKTSFSHKLLQHGDLFSNNVKEVIYYHPDYLADIPLSWHKTLKIPVSYQSGIPTLDELCALKPHTCVVLDDLYEECINSSAIDYLFRVLSGKFNLSVLILSQRYFAKGKFGLNIRNNCNYTVLMRNVDARLNVRVAGALSLRIAIQKAIDDTYANNYWPYIFIDSTPKAQVSTYRCYTDIFNKFQIAFRNNGMKAYIISETDFLRNFELSGNNTAIKRDGSNSEKELRKKIREQKSETQSDSIRKIEDNFEQEIQTRAKKLRKKRRRFRKNIY